MCWDRIHDFTVAALRQLPGRLAAQLFSDTVVAAWTFLWVHGAVAGIAGALALAATPAGEQLLALRALASRPLRELTAVSPDPVAAWRRQAPAVIGELAGVELRSAGLARCRRSTTPAG